MSELWCDIPCALSWVIVVFATEALSEIVTTSKFSAPFRGALARLVGPSLGGPPPDPSSMSLVRRAGIWLNALVGCGYCFSLWAALSVSWLAVGPETSSAAVAVVVYLIKALAVHRLSNWLHVLYEIIRRGRVKTYDIQVTHHVTYPKE